MVAFLDGISSLEYWRFYANAERHASAPNKHRKPAASRIDEIYANAKPAKEDLIALSQKFPKLSKPYHLLSAKANLRLRTKEAVNRAARPQSVPTGSFVKLSDNLYVCSPEFCFCRLGLLLDPPALAKIGFELSGFYRKDPNGPCIKGKPLTSASRLTDFSGKYSGDGCRNARKAALLVIDSSASPMETFLALSLILPKNEGGFGLPRPKLNHRISKGRASHHSVFGNAFYCDLYWPDSRIAIEYDSDSFHTAEKRIEHDARRRNALASLGVAVITATKNQIGNVDGMNQLACQAAKRIGVRLRLERINKRAQSQLLKEISE